MTHVELSAEVSDTEDNKEAERVNLMPQLPQLPQRKSININDVHNNHKPQHHTKSQRKKPSVSTMHSRVPSQASDTEENKEEEEQIDHRVTIYGNGHAGDVQSESVDAAVPAAVGEQSPLDKYENKVEELQTIALVSTLILVFLSLFGLTSISSYSTMTSSLC